MTVEVIQLQPFIRQQPPPTPIIRVQTTVGENQLGPGDEVVTASFGVVVTAGNTIIVITRVSSDFNPNNSVISVLDSLGTFYNAAVSAPSGDPANPGMEIWHGVPPVSGSTAITVKWSSDVIFAWAFAIEVSGFDLVGSLDAAISRFFPSGSFDITTDPFSTTQGDEYVVMAASQITFCSYLAGVDFTLIDGLIPSVGGPYGGCQEFITVNPLVAYTAHITSDAPPPSDSGTVVLASFRG